jgi:hypothetical protein
MDAARTAAEAVEVIDVLDVLEHEALAERNRLIPTRLVPRQSTNRVRRHPHRSEGGRVFSNRELLEQVWGVKSSGPHADGLGGIRLVARTIRG